MSLPEDFSTGLSATEANRLRDEYAADFARLAPDLVHPPRPPMTAEDEAELDEILRAHERTLNDEEEEDDYEF